MFIGLIPCHDLTCRPVEIDGSLESYQKVVGGWLETAPTFQKGLLLLIDEEGKLSRKPVNLLATAVSPYREFDVLVGDAVLVRLNDAGNDWTGWDDADAVLLAFDSLTH